jgi:hypothetical protein
VKILKQKRLVMAAGEWWFHWNNVLLHTTTIMTEWMVARQI